MPVQPTPQGGAANRPRWMDTNELSVKDLAEAASRHVRLTNRYWLSLAVLSLFSTSPPAAAGGKVQLPLGFGMVDEAYFAFAIAMAMSALVVAFCTAHAQSYRSQGFANQILDSRRPEARGAASERDYYNALRESAVIWVSPLAEIRGWRSHRGSSLTKHASGALYLYLKILAEVIYLGLPAVALWLAVRRYADAEDPFLGHRGLAWPFVAGAIIGLLRITWMEFAAVLDRWRQITK